MIIGSEELKRIYAERNPNGNWFEADTMKFFGSKIEHISQHCSKIIFFITSEQYKSSRVTEPRKFTIRKMPLKGMETVGEFQQYKTLGQAKTSLNRILEK